MHRYKRLYKESPPISSGVRETWERDFELEFRTYTADRQHFEGKFLVSKLVPRSEAKSGARFDWQATASRDGLEASARRLGRS